MDEHGRVWGGKGIRCTCGCRGEEQVCTWRVPVVHFLPSHLPNSFTTTPSPPHPIVPHPAQLRPSGSHHPPVMYLHQAFDARLTSWGRR